MSKLETNYERAMKKIDKIEQDLKKDKVLLAVLKRLEKR